MTTRRRTDELDEIAKMIAHYITDVESDQRFVLYKLIADQLTSSCQNFQASHFVELMNRERKAP